MLPNYADTVGPVSLERLWSPWRNAYVTSGGAVGEVPGDATASVFSRILASGLPDNETHIVWRGEYCFAILNAFPYTSGHVMLLPYRQVADLEALTPEETVELWSAVTTTTTAIKRAYRPDGLNVGINLGRAAGGSITEHIHVHVLPRWVGDGNFMTAIADTRTLPEALTVSATKIRAAWPNN
jgi:diadenosine tetraphosphate (Ap4A) HIT family hydrolase